MADSQTQQQDQNTTNNAETPKTTNTQKRRLSPAEIEELRRQRRKAKIAQNAADRMNLICGITPTSRQNEVSNDTTERATTPELGLHARHEEGQVKDVNSTELTSSSTESTPTTTPNVTPTKSTPSPPPSLFTFSSEEHSPSRGTDAIESIANEIAMKSAKWLWNRISAPQPKSTTDYVRALFALLLGVMVAVLYHVELATSWTVRSNGVWPIVTVELLLTTASLFPQVASSGMELLQPFVLALRHSSKILTDLSMYFAGFVVTFAVLSSL